MQNLTSGTRNEDKLLVDAVEKAIYAIDLTDMLITKQLAILLIDRMWLLMTSSFLA